MIITRRRRIKVANLSVHTFKMAPLGNLAGGYKLALCALKHSTVSAKHLCVRFIGGTCTYILETLKHL